MPTALIIGATRGLGAALVDAYSASPSTTIYGTTRSTTPPPPHHPNLHWIPQIDLLSPTCATTLTSGLPASTTLNTVIITAGIFPRESLGGLDWDAEVKTYVTSAIAPVFLVGALAGAGMLREGAKVILVGSEAGSVALRHEKEGGGNYAHHGSKAAVNMVGRLLSLDLADKGVAVGIVHPGFMRTEMTKNVGFDKYWESGGAVTPAEAASSLVDFISTFDMSKTGQFWAPRGPRDIGTAEAVMGEGLPTPLKLPW